MPYLIKALAGTRRDPNARRRHKKPSDIRRAYSRLKIGKRALKPGRGMTISDAMYKEHEEHISALATAGVITLLSMGNKPEEREQLHAPPPMPPEPILEAPPEPEPEEPERGVFEINMMAGDPIVEEPEIQAAPEAAPEQPKKTSSGKRRGRKKKS